MGQQERYPGAGAGEPGVGTNRGIFIGGGNSGIVASGHARITQVTHGSKVGDPLEMIDQLLRKLEADANALAGEQADDVIDDVIDDVHRLGTEVHRRKLSAENILVALSRLKTAAASSAALLATVDQIKDLITVILH